MSPLGTDLARTMGYCPEHGWQDASLPYRACPQCGETLQDDEPTTRISVCVDCLFMLAGGVEDWTPAQIDEWEANVARIWGDTFITLGDTEDDTEFSWSPCEMCGSTLGGSRHTAYAINGR